MRKDISGLYIVKKDSIKEALKKMSEAGDKILIVIDDQNKMIGVLTDGNIRRWILDHSTIDGCVGECYNADPYFLSEQYDIESAKELMVSKKIECLPVINSLNQVVGMLRWNDLFKEEKPDYSKIDCPVAIMAGGKGTRLDPFTRILPKPLIPINDKAVLEIIMEKFAVRGVQQFYLSVNHKAKIIKAFFEESDVNYNIDYIQEDKPLGTAGSLRFLCGRIKGSMIVTNCDVIVKSDYKQMVEFHKDTDSDITIIGAMRHFTVPYGVCEIENGGNLIGIKEKPEYDFFVNTGMYVIKTSVLSKIPGGMMFHFTDLINSVKESGGKITVFPIEESAWIDVGQWEEYRRAQELLKSNF